MNNQSKILTIFRFICFLVMGLMMILFNVNVSKAQTTAPSVPKYTWRFAGVQPHGFPQDDACNYFAARVFERTNGKVKINVYPAMQLGDPVKLFESVQRGLIDMAVCVAYPFVDSRFNITNLPFLVQTFDEADKLYWSEGWFNSFLRNVYEEKKIKFLGAFDIEFRGVSNSKRAIRNPEDLKGLKLRDPGIAPYSAFFGALGAKTIMVPFADLYTALQQGVVDGQENGPVQTFSQKFYEIQRYYTWLKQAYTVGCFGINLQLFNSLAPDIQKMLLDEGKEAERVMINGMRGMQTKCIQQMESAGVEVFVPNSKELKKFKEIGRSVWPQFEDKIGKENMIKLRAQMKTIGIE